MAKTPSKTLLPDEAERNTRLEKLLSSISQSAEFRSQLNSNLDPDRFYDEEEDEMEIIKQWNSITPTMKEIKNKTVDNAYSDQIEWSYDKSVVKITELDAFITRPKTELKFGDKLAGTEIKMELVETTKPNSKDRAKEIAAIDIDTIWPDSRYKFNDKVYVSADYKPSIKEFKVTGAKSEDILNGKGLEKRYPEEQTSFVEAQWPVFSEISQGNLTNAFVQNPDLKHPSIEAIANEEKIAKNMIELEALVFEKIKLLADLWLTNLFIWIAEPMGDDEIIQVHERRPDIKATWKFKEELFANPIVARFITTKARWEAISVEFAYAILRISNMEPEWKGKDFSLRKHNDKISAYPILKANRAWVLQQAMLDWFKPYINIKEATFDAKAFEAAAKLYPDIAQYIWLALLDFDRSYVDLTSMAPNLKEILNMTVIYAKITRENWIRRNKIDQEALDLGQQELEAAKRDDD